MPTADFNGTDSFQYEICDIDGECAFATATVNIAPVQDTNTDTISTNEDTPTTFNVLANDNFAGNTSLIGVNQPANGQVVFSVDGSVTYTPDADFFGTDTFEYTVETESGTFETGTIEVDVLSQNDGQADDLVIDEDTPVNFDPLANDTFSGPVTITSVTQGNNGSVTLEADGTLTFDPQADYYGQDVFTYTVTDSHGQTETVTVTVEVTAVSDTVNDFISTPEDTMVSFNVLANDTFSGGATLTDVSSASNGTISFNPDGTVNYLPAPDWSGTESIVYTVTTSDGNTETGVLTIEVQSVNDPPQFDETFPTQVLPVNAAVSIDVSAVVSDVEGHEITFELTGTLPPGLSFDPNTGIISGTILPTADTVNPYNISVTATDELGASATTTIEWNIRPELTNLHNPFADTVENDVILPSAFTGVTEELTTRPYTFSAAQPVIFGYAAEGTVLLGRIYNVDGVQIGETTMIVGASGTWIMGFNTPDLEDTTSIQVLHLATEDIPIGSSDFRVYGD